VKQYIVSLEAESDLMELWLYYVGEVDVTLADRIQDELVESFQRISDTPGIGHRRQDLTTRDVFFYRLYQYMIVYRKGDTVEIVSVLHRKRDLQRILSERYS
jgi:toxin ParE1/3/4